MCLALGLDHYSFIGSVLFGNIFPFGAILLQREGRYVWNWVLVRVRLLSHVLVCFVRWVCAGNPEAPTDQRLLSIARTISLLLLARL